MRDDDQTIRRRDYPDYRNEIADRIQAAAGGRSQGPAAGYYAREESARLGTEGEVRGRNHEDDRVFQRLLGKGRARRTDRVTPKAPTSRETPSPKFQTNAA